MENGPRTISVCGLRILSILTQSDLAYYVVGGGVKAAIQMDNIAATNGIIHYIDRVLGVPYQSLWEILRNETDLQ